MPAGPPLSFPPVVSGNPVSCFFVPLFVWAGMGEDLDSRLKMSGMTERGLPTSGTTEGRLPTSGMAEGRLPTSGMTAGGLPMSGMTAGGLPMSVIAEEGVEGVGHDGWQALAPLSCPDNPSPQPSPARGEGVGCASVMPAGPSVMPAGPPVMPAGPPVMPAGPPLSFPPVVSGNPVSCFFVPLFVGLHGGRLGFPIKNVGNDRKGITNVGYGSGGITNGGCDLCLSNTAS